MGLHVQKLMPAQRRKNRFLAQQIPHDFLGGAEKFLIETVVRSLACLMKCSGRCWLAWSRWTFLNSCAHSQAGEVSFLILLRGVAKSLICLAFNWTRAGKGFRREVGICMGSSASADPRATSATSSSAAGQPISRCLLASYILRTMLAKMWSVFVQLSPSSHLTAQDPLPAFVVKGPRMETSRRHHIAAAWNGKQFRVKIDGLAFQTCNVKPAVVSPPPHAHAFLVFAYEGNALRGRGEPAPSSISPSVQPLCRLCAFDNQALSEVTCCLLCHIVLLQSRWCLRPVQPCRPLRSLSLTPCVPSPGCCWGRGRLSMDLWCRSLLSILAHGYMW